MNAGRLTLIVAGLTALLFLTAGILTAEQEMPEEIMIYNKGYKRKLYQPVRFTHQTHAEDYGIECNECHHDYKGGENVWEEGDPVKKCIVCHSPLKKRGEKVHRLVFAYHFKCKRCHKENESGPVKCKECHTKEKK